MFNDSFVHGIFFGALVICLLMLNVAQDGECAISYRHNDIHVVSVGHWHRWQ